jgi:signal transduction histidine kinase
MSRSERDRPLSLLIVEGYAPAAAGLRKHVSEPPMADPDIEEVPTLDAALGRLRANTYDAVLLDLGLADSFALDTYDMVAAAAPTAAIVVLAGPDESGLAAEAVRRGAQDYLIRGDRRTGQIARTVFYAIRRQRLVNELQAARNEQLAQKDKFLSRVSHELRSPLAVLYQFTSLLADGLAGPLTEEQLDMLGVVLRNADQLRHMIDDLLQVSRAKQGKVLIESVRFPLGEVLAQIVTGFQPEATQRGVTLVFHEAPIPEVVADPRRVQEVLGNLLDNSLRFTPAGGRIDVLMQLDPHAVRITVRDTGCGISAEHLPHVFEQFYQADQAGHSRHGLGLGLYICRDLVERQGGQISAESEVGRGTSISLTLPTEPRRARVGGPAASEATQPN